MSYRAKPLAERFWRHVDRRGPDECWPWTGCRSEHDYGRMGNERTCLAAHRASWIVHHGAIPPGLCVLHRCDNPPCVNPRHLFLGTQLDNIADMHAKGRASGGRTPRPGETHPNAVLTDEIVLAIRSRREAGETYRSLSRAFGVSTGHLHRIVNRTAWSHLS